METLSGVTAIVEAVTRGKLTCTQIARAGLERAAHIETWLRAFAWLDPARVEREAQALDAALDLRRRRGEAMPLLAGVPVGVKDIVDTAGIPTECGAALFAGRIPERSATLVEYLTRSGALVFGKTVTAECAFFHPGPTRNPWDQTRTPGGSSMGSAAAVAAGIVPAAVGSQTNGSVIRPAAFCGVVGFKPTAGRILTSGVLRFSPTLDTIGGFARTVEGVAHLCAALAGEPLAGWWDGPDEGRRTNDGGPLPFVLRPSSRSAHEVAGHRLAVVRTAEWDAAEPAMRERFEADVAALRAAGATVEEATLPDGLDERAIAVHRTIMQREAAENLGALIAERPDRVSDTLRVYVEGGATIAGRDYEAALRQRLRWIDAFLNWSAAYDAILSPPALGEAPGPETTGDPRFCTRWTLVGAPALSLPTGLGPNGLPLGLQLAGTPGDDRRLLRAAAAVERVIGMQRQPLTS
jgi:Asp-tRNA(Asn)/Glu-tRNA(Gln) amidotransferase A subunit family amidase